MEDLSLHILDIVENSTAAGATLVEINICENREDDILKVTIKDNGRGMDGDMLKRVRDPFATTRTTRRIGLGVSLLDQASREAEGGLEIESKKDEGTNIIATFKLSHIDRKPIGDIGSTIITLIMGNPDIDFIYKSNIDGRGIEIDTREIRSELDGLSISDPLVLNLIRDLFKE